MEQRYFTAEEANEALLEVRPLTEELVGHRRALVELQERQSAVTARIAGNGGNVEPHELEEVQAQLDEEVAGIARCVARIHEVGALVKDLDDGLVDFPATRDGRDVLLCWRLGEDEVGFWHGLDEGFLGPQASLAGRSKRPRPHPGGEVGSSTRHPLRAYSRICVADVPIQRQLTHVAPAAEDRPPARRIERPWRSGNAGCS